MVERIADIDVELAKAVANMVGGEPPNEARHRPNKGHRAKALSQLEFVPIVPTIASRRVAILVADGFDATEFWAVYGALAAQKAVPVVIGPRRNAIAAAHGKGVTPHHNLEGFRSTMVDAVYIPGGAQSVETLGKNGRAIHWIREAFGHLKAIGATGDAVSLVHKAVGLAEVKTSTSTDVVESYGVVTLADTSAHPDTLAEAVDIVKDSTHFVDNLFYQISQHRSWPRQMDRLHSQVAY
jgi:catalase